MQCESTATCRRSPFAPALPLPARPQELDGIDWQPVATAPEGAKVAQPLKRVAPPPPEPEPSHLSAPPPRASAPGAGRPAALARALAGPGKGAFSLAGVASVARRALLSTAAAVSSKALAAGTAAVAAAAATAQDNQQLQEMITSGKLDEVAAEAAVEAAVAAAEAAAEEQRLEELAMLQHRRAFGNLNRYLSRAASPAELEDVAEEDEHGGAGRFAGGRAAAVRLVEEVPRIHGGLGTLTDAESLKKLVKMGTMRRAEDKPPPTLTMLQSSPLAPASKDPRSLANFVQPAGVSIPTTLPPGAPLGDKTQLHVAAEASGVALAGAGARSTRRRRLSTSPSRAGALDYEGSHMDEGFVGGASRRRESSPGTRSRRQSMAGHGVLAPAGDGGLADGQAARPAASAVSPEDALALGLFAGPKNPNRTLALARLAVSLMQPAGAPGPSAAGPQGLAAEPSSGPARAAMGGVGRISMAFRAGLGQLHVEGDGGAAAQAGGGAAGAVGPDGTPLGGAAADGSAAASPAMAALEAVLGARRPKVVTKATVAEIVGRTPTAAQLLWRRARDAVRRLLANYPAEVGDMMKEAGLTGAVLGCRRLVD